MYCTQNAEFIKKWGLPALGRFQSTPLKLREEPNLKALRAVGVKHIGNKKVHPHRLHF
jgi:hypothetical protein